MHATRAESPARRREVVAGLCALALHALVLKGAGGFAATPAASPGALVDDASAGELWVDLTKAPSGLAEPSPGIAKEGGEPEPVAPIAAASRPRADSLTAPATPATPTANGAPGSEGGPTPAGPSPAPTTPSDGWTPRPAGTTPVYLLPGVFAPAAPSAAPTSVASAGSDPRAGTKALASTLSSQTASLGLDLPAASSVASAVADAVRGIDLPADARGAFEVRLSKDGRVESVKVGKVSAGEGAAWDRAAAAAKGALAGRALAMGPRGEAATVTVNVESSLRYASGSKNPTELEPVCSTEALAEIERLLATMGADLTLDTGGGASDIAGQLLTKASELRKALCIPVGVRAQGDASDIGGKAHRVVTTKVSVKRDGELVLPAGPVLPVDTRPSWTPPDPTKTRPTLGKKKPWWEERKRK